MNLGIRPFDGKRGPPQSILWSNCTWITEAIAKGCRIWSKAIRVGEGSGEFETCVLTKLHKDP